MELVLLALADSVTALADGRLDLSGAAPEYWRLADIPGECTVPVAMVVGFPMAEADLSHYVTLRFSSDSAGELLSQRVELQPGVRDPEGYVDGALAHFSVPIAMEVRFENVGGHVLEVLDADKSTSARSALAFDSQPRPIRKPELAGWPSLQRMDSAPY